MPITLVPGQNTLNRGMIPLPPPTANLGGLIYDSFSAAPIAGATVSLFDGVQTRQTISDGAGNYLFSGIPTGPYTMTVTAPAYLDRVIDIVLVAGDNGLSVAMNPAVASLSGLVTDAGNGVPLSGVLVTVMGTGISGLTNGSGVYSLSNIPIGTYSVSFELAGYETLVI